MWASVPSVWEVVRPSGTSAKVSATFRSSLATSHRVQCGQLV
jgi:hypothetical protein